MQNIVGEDEDKDSEDEEGDSESESNNADSEGLGTVTPSCEGSEGEFEDYDYNRCTDCLLQDELWERYQILSYTWDGMPYTGETSMYMDGDIRLCEVNNIAYTCETSASMGGNKRPRDVETGDLRSEGWEDLFELGNSLDVSGEGEIGRVVGPDAATCGSRN